MYLFDPQRRSLWLSLFFLMPLIVGAGDAGRTPVPGQAAQEKALALVLEVFQDDLKAPSPDARAKLAAALLQQGREAKDDSVLRYVLFREARDLAARAGDAPLAFVAVEELSRRYDVNALALKAEALTLASQETTNPDAAKAIVDLSLPLLKEALDADQYDAARALGQAAEQAASRAKSKELVEEVRRRNEEVRAVEKGFARLQTFVERLKKNPDEPEANLELGKYYGFFKRNWDKALPLLAKGGDETLRQLARRDLAGPKDAHDRLALADAWWERAAAEQDPAKLALQARAATWYDRALGQVAGLNRTKALKRFERVNERLRGLAAPSSLAAGPVGEIKKFEGHTDEIKGVAFSPDGRYGVSGGLDQTVRVWDLAAGKEERVLRGHTKQVWDVAFLPNNRQVLSTSWDTTARLWDVKNGNEIRRYNHRLDVNGLAVARDGNTFLTGNDDHHVYLWDAHTGAELRRYPGHTNFVYAVAFSPDGRLIASGGVDKTVRVFERNTGQQIAVFDGHNNSVTEVAFTPDGRYVLSAGDGVIHQWEIATGKESRRFQGHSGLVPAMALSPDGRRLVTGGDDRTLRLWDVATGKELHKLEGHTDTVTSVAFSADGRRVLSGSLDRTVRLWGLPVR